MLNDILALNQLQWLPNRSDFHDLNTELDRQLITSGFYGAFATGMACQQGTLTFRTPGSVTLFGTCLWSNCWDRISRTFRVFTRLFTLDTPLYFLNLTCTVCTVTSRPHQVYTCIVYATDVRETSTTLGRSKLKTSRYDITKVKVIKTTSWRNKCRTVNLGDKCMAVVARTDCPTSIHYRCVIESFDGVFMLLRHLMKYRWMLNLSKPTNFAI